MNIQASLIGSVWIISGLGAPPTNALPKVSQGNFLRPPWLTQSTQAQNSPPTLSPSPLSPSTLTDPQQLPIFFRTKSYQVQIIWRRERPYMSVSHNSSRVLADVRAKMTHPRGDKDAWTSYSALSGDYMAVVRVGPTGEGVIEVRRSGQRITQEYALPSVRKNPAESNPIQGQNPSGQTRSEQTVLVFATDRYAVHVYRQTGELYLNLHNKQSKVTELKRVPVEQVNTSDGTVYRYDGDSTVQAREDFKGRRTLLILRDNEIQYRGEGN